MKSSTKKLPRFLFVQPENENIGVEYLCASLKKFNIPVDMLFLAEPFHSIAFHISNKGYLDPQKPIISRIQEFKPDVVCFSPFSSQYDWAIKQAKFVKSKFPNTFILFGGVHVNSVPNLVIKNKYIDAIIVGEADHQIVQFAKSFYSPKLFQTPSLWIKHQGILIKNPLALLEKNLDVFPFPDKEIFYSQIPPQLREQNYLIMGSRGCPFHCSYCSNNLYERLYLGQKRLRFRSPQNIIRELQIAQKNFQPKMIEFFDDVLTVNVDRLQKLLVLYRRHIKLPFTCYLHPQLVTEKTIKMLAKSNCCWLKLGVQSANEDYRKKYLNRYETNDDIIKSSLLCRQYHLPFSLDHIFNLPGETEADLVAAVKLYNVCRPTIINFGTLIYLPGTDIINLGLKYKNISPKDVVRINNGLDPVFKLANIDLISYQYSTIKSLNISAFSLMFMIITIFPPFITNLLLSLKFYRLKYPVPQFIIVFFKILAKLRAHQLYIYRSVLKTMFYYSLNLNHQYEPQI